MACPAAPGIFTSVCQLLPNLQMTDVRSLWKSQTLLTREPVTLVTKLQRDCEVVTNDEL